MPHGQEASGDDHWVLASQQQDTDRNNEVGGRSTQWKQEKQKSKNIPLPPAIPVEPGKTTGAGGPLSVCVKQRLLGQRWIQILLVALVCEVQVWWVTLSADEGCSAPGTNLTFFLSLSC